MAVNISEKGEELGAFLDATGDPLGDFIFSVGVAVALLGIFLAIVYVIKRVVGNIKLR